MTALAKLELLEAAKDHSKATGHEGGHIHFTIPLRCSTHFLVALA
jgi:hypothetical protein